MDDQDSLSRLREVSEKLGVIPIGSLALSDGLIVAIAPVNSPGLVTYISEVAAAMFGYLPQELEGQPLTKLMPERYHKAHQAGLDRTRITGEGTLIGQVAEVVGLRKDGSEFALDVLISTPQTQTQPMVAILRDRSRVIKV